MVSSPWVLRGPMLPLLAAVALCGALGLVSPEPWRAVAAGAALVLLGIAAVLWIRLHRQVSVIASEWQLTVDTVDFPLVTVDAAGRVVRMNRAAMLLTGRPYLGNLGRPLAELGPGEPWASAAALLPAARAGAVTRHVEEPPPADEAGEDAAGGRHWEISVRPIPDPGGARPGFVVLGRDVSERVRLEERLRRRELMVHLGSLVGSVAHEVRSPLYALQSTVDAMDARLGGRPELADFMPVLRDSMDHLQTLMQALLDYGKPIRPELKPEPLAPLAEDARQACAVVAEKRGVGIEIATDPGLPAVEMDRERIFQVLRNLLENAVQHTPAGGRVKLSVRPTEGSVELEVRDTGPGFRDQDLPHLFDPFFSRRSGGTGLGLAIVRRVVEQHGGEVAAANQPGGGASVRVWLPVHRAAA